MKNLLLVIIGLLLFNFISHAQISFNRIQESNRIYGISTYPSLKEKIVQQQGVQKFSEYRVIEKKNGKTKKLQRSEEIYDSLGKIISDIGFNRGKVKTIREYCFNKQGKATDEKVKNNKGENILHYEAIYNDQGQVKEYRMFEKNKETPEYEYVGEYDSNKLKKSVSYKKGKLRFTTLYEYYDNGSREKTQLYNAKGKLKYTWAYDCDQEGEISTKHKDTTQYCQWSRIDSSGNLVRVYQIANDKNKIIKYVLTYDRDTNMLESRSYDKNDVIQHKLTFLKGINQYHEYYSYKHGKLKTFRINNYNDQGVRIEYKMFKYKGKNETLVTHYQYQYDSKGLLEKTQAFHKGKPTYMAEAKYIYY